MSDCSTSIVGLDLGDTYTHYFELSVSGAELSSGRIPTSQAGMIEWFKNRKQTRVVMEVGTHSPWLSRLLKELGHEVIVANPRRVRLISDNIRKTDQADAELLARLGRVDPQLLYPVEHRSEHTQCALIAIKARDQLVRSRTSMIVTVRALLKSLGIRIGSCSAYSFHKRFKEEIFEPHATALRPLVNCIKKLTFEIRFYDKQIEKTAKTNYPMTKVLRTVSGVGPITALTFILIIEDPQRFAKSRSVGPYLGLCPRCHQSGGSNPELRISKAGNSYVRRLLVQCAHYILGRGPDSDLKRWGHGIVAKGGKRAKKRAAIAVARKLAVLLHRMLVTGDEYQPFLEPASSEQSA